MTMLYDDDNDEAAEFRGILEGLGLVDASGVAFRRIICVCPTEAGDAAALLTTTSGHADTAHARPFSVTVRGLIADPASELHGHEAGLYVFADDVRLAQVLSEIRAGMEVYSDLAPEPLLQAGFLESRVPSEELRRMPRGDRPNLCAYRATPRAGGPSTLFRVQDAEHCLRVLVSVE